MPFRFILAFAALASYFCSAGAGDAQFIPQGKCAIIVASRQSLKEAKQFIAENPALGVQNIYQASNGWLAISVGNIRELGSTAELGHRKSLGQIPPDAYCSKGGSYRKVVWRSQNGSEQTERHKYAQLFDGLDPSTLSRDDKRFLQAALAFEGHYTGLLDGDWGRLSRAAMSRWSRAEFGTASENWHMALLAYSLFEQMQNDGWEMNYFRGLGMSLLVPGKTLRRAADTENFVNYNHSDSSLAISIGVLTQRVTEAVHKYTLNTHALSSEPYTVRKKGIAVSAVTQKDGSQLYTRSDFVNGLWSTIMVSASRWDKNLLNAVTSSVSVGNARPLQFTTNGSLDHVIGDTVALIAEYDAEETEADGSAGTSAEVARRDEKGEGGGTGSGFFVTENGYVITNAHVVDGCSEIMVDGQKAELVDESEDFDLALLHVPDAKIEGIASFANTPAGLNADVTVVGYPYGGLLGGLNVTRGSVSASKGLGGNATRMQITAPVQSGNSGGPLLASNGSVVGIVVAKLDALIVADALGDLPQNVNYAVRGEIAKLFMAQNGIVPRPSTQELPVEPEKLAQIASAFTAFIECE